MTQDAIFFSASSVRKQLQRPAPYADSSSAGAQFIAEYTLRLAAAIPLASSSCTKQEELHLSWRYRCRDGGSTL